MSTKPIRYRINGEACARVGHWHPIRNVQQYFDGRKFRGHINKADAERVAEQCNKEMGKHSWRFTVAQDK